MEMKNENVEKIVESTTTIISDGVTVDNTLTAPNALSNIQVRDQSIIDFLAKPLRVASGSWDVSATGTLLQTLAPAVLLEANTYWASKVQGFGLYRGTAVFRLMINATPFQCGKLLMCFLPQAAEVNTLDPSYLPMHTHNIAAYRMLPSVELDCRETAATLKIPYIAPSHFVDRKARSFASGGWDWGQVYLVILSQLRNGAGATDVTVDYSIYLSFEDFELAAPQVPQAGKKFSSSNEATAESFKPISGGLKVAANVATALGGVPVLAPVMSTVSWVANRLSGIASAFGWAKPLSESSSAIMSAQYNRYAATSDGVDCSFPLALQVANKLEVINTASIFEEDEMSFEFLKRRETVVAYYTWATSQVAGTAIITKLQATPATFAYSDSVTRGAHTTFFSQGPPLFFLANGFKYWRGSIELIFKIVKTDYHTGRLQVTFTPSNLGSTSPDLSTGMLALREIIDLKTGNEFCLRLPYLLPLDYVKTGFPSNYDASGFLDMVILNELRAPDTCTQTIDILMYARAGPDFELAAPRGFPLPVYSPQSSVNFTSGNEQVVCETIGNYKDEVLNLKHAATCIGESFSSIKQILSRFNQMPYNLFNGATTVSTPGLSVWPWASGTCYTTSSAGFTSGNVGGDAYSMYNGMYAYRRGGVRVQFVPVLKSTANIAQANFKVAATNEIFPSGGANSVNWTSLAAPPGYQSAWKNSNAAGWAYWNAVNGQLPTNPGNYGVVTCDVTPGFMAVTVPYYAQTRMSFNIRSNTTDAVPGDVTQPSYGASFYCESSFTGGSIYRSFEDDFQLMYYIGCPPLATSST